MARSRTTVSIPQHGSERRSAGFLALYALAHAGGVLAFLPLLTLLLPLKVEAIAGDARLGVLTLATLAGAVAASAANIGFGHLSDRTYAARGSRTPWILAGLVATIASYGAIHAAVTTMTLVAAIVAFQLALNMMLAPLFAVMADAVPDAQKGVAGGLLAFATPAASIAGGLLAGTAWLDEGQRLAAICAVVVAMIAPLLLFARTRVVAAPPAAAAGAAATRPRIDLGLIWLSRLLVQVAGNVLFTYLLFFFEVVDASHPPIMVAGRIGQVTGIAFLASVPIAMLVGRASDRLGVRRPFLVAAAVSAAAGLTAMALAQGWAGAVAGYALFANGSALFLALHSAYAMQVLPSPAHRGRDLGLLNLTNTLPALLGPALTWLLVRGGGFHATLLVLAALTLAGGALIGVARRT